LAVQQGSEEGGVHPLDRGDRFRVLEDGDLICGGQDALFKEGGTEQRVYNATLAAVKLADNDQQEWLVQPCTALNFTGDHFK
jgi:hypothetical protein